ncbi:TRSP domain-containing protein, partial [Anaerotruncus colihominis]|uniref:TRSP domain-containing protein n=1 Tax=Anaerotruncus colihominis TaxID=169435 RepID=UPI00210B5986
PALADLTGAAGSSPTLLDPGIFLPGTGRRLMTQERLAALRRACRTAADKIGAPDAPRTLYLGSGELIYAPALIAGFCGGGAFHSTMQSPVFPLPGSAIVSGV